MNIPFHKPHITQKEVDSVCTALQSGWLTMGPKTIEFEEAFQDYIGTKYTISVNSATAALHLALNAVDVSKDDEVIIPTSTFISTAEAVVYSGAQPVLCDIEDKNHIHRSDHFLFLNSLFDRYVSRQGCPCQKQPFTKIANFLLLLLKSGLPAKSLT